MIQMCTLNLKIRFHGIPRNLESANSTDTSSSMECHRIPWNFGCANFVDMSSSTEFHGIPWNLECANFTNTNNSMKFQYRNSYFEHPGVCEIGTRSAKMAFSYMMKSAWERVRSGDVSRMQNIRLSKQWCLAIYILTKRVTYLDLFCQFIWNTYLTPTHAWHKTAWTRELDIKYI